MSFLLALIYSLSAWAAFDELGLELVYTAPVETKLQAPDLRDPATVWVEMIDGAKKTLVFEEQYAFNKAGEPLEQVLAAMERAGARGVKTRFLLEKKMMHATDPATVDRLKNIKGMELRIFEFGKLGTDGIVHAKYFLVDAREAFLGSQNFDWRSLKHIHETGLRITNKKIVQQLAQIFEKDWRGSGLLEAGKKIPALKKATKLPHPGNAPVYLTASPAELLPPGVIFSEQELIRLLGNAQEEVRIQLLDYSAYYRNKKYYAPIDTALRTAAARGVKVKLMVSHWNTKKPGVDSLKSLSMLPNIEIRIVTIPVGKDGRIPYARVSHSKIMTIDHKISWVGTSNWSGGYFDQLRNLELVVSDEKFAQRVAALHEQLWSSEYSAKLDATKDYPKPDKGVDSEKE